MVALNGRPALLSLRLIGAVLKLRLAACLTRFESGRVRLMARLKKPGTDHRPCPLFVSALGDDGLVLCATTRRRAHRRNGLGGVSQAACSEVVGSSSGR